jgi:Protein of unknown function (DUF3467)
MPWACCPPMPSDNPKPERKYANYLQVGYNGVEIILEFGQHFAGDGSVQLHSSILATPFYAKRFAEVLAKSLSDYEARFGPIRDEDR